MNRSGKKEGNFGGLPTLNPKPMTLGRSGVWAQGLGLLSERVEQTWVARASFKHDRAQEWRDIRGHIHFQVDVNYKGVLSIPLEA